MSLTGPNSPRGETTTVHITRELTVRTTLGASPLRGATGHWFRPVCHRWKSAYCMLKTAMSIMSTTCSAQCGTARHELSCQKTALRRWVSYLPSNVRTGLATRSMYPSILTESCGRSTSVIPLGLSRRRAKNFLITGDWRVNGPMGHR